MRANVYFKDGATYQEKSAFKGEEKMQILIQANASDIMALDKSITNIYAGIYINDFTKPVTGISATVAEWSSKTQVKQVLVIPENNFKDGPNNIQVKFFQANTDISLGASSATVQASGVGGAATVSWTPGGTSLAVGETIKFQPKNFTSNTTAEIKINKKSFRTGLSATALSDIQIPVDKDLFNEAVNTVEVIVNKNDGSQPTIITLANFSVAEGTGAKPGAPGSGSGGADSRLPETLYNPLPTESLTGTILTIAKGFLAIVALWAVVFIIIGGFRMVLSQGNEEAYLAAKKTITWAVLGVVVAMLSFSIIAIVQSLLGVSVPDFPDSQTPVVENKETSQ